MPEHVEDSDLWLTGPTTLIDDACAVPLRPRCARCGVTVRGRLWKLRHRIGTCHPARLEVRARVLRRRDECWPGEIPF